MAREDPDLARERVFRWWGKQPVERPSRAALYGEKSELAQNVHRLANEMNRINLKLDLVLQKLNLLLRKSDENRDNQTSP